MASGSDFNRMLIVNSSERTRNWPLCPGWRRELLPADHSTEQFRVAGVSVNASSQRELKLRFAEDPRGRARCISDFSVPLGAMLDRHVLRIAVQVVVSLKMLARRVL
jgi:hypothetical protein